MKYIRRLLFPFSLLYGIITRIRNLFYDKGIFQSASYKIPVICIGNLSTGGTGKTPHVEFLVNFLSQKFRVAVLSRGYKRKTSGFFEVQINSDAFEVGDEPLQIKQKFTNANVFVCENRTLGIRRILEQYNETDVIILDDALQHRRVNATLNILLTPFDSLYVNDYLLPMGNLRESRGGAKRAKVIVITKCPDNLTDDAKKEVQKKLNLEPYQELFFSGLEYNSLQNLFSVNQIHLSQLSNKNVLVVTAIASFRVLINFLKPVSHSIEHVKFADHHYFNTDDITTIRRKFDNIASPSKIIVCTEKDAVKLRDAKNNSAIKDLPFYFLPIKAVFENQEEIRFKKLVESYVGKN